MPALLIDPGSIVHSDRVLASLFGEDDIHAWAGLR